MFDLYPDILVRVLPGGEPADGNGDYAPQVPARQEEFAVCRAVRNGSGQMVTLEGGTEYRYAYVVYMPAGTAVLKVGTQVKILSREDGTLVATGRVKDFVSSPLGCKLWI